MTTRQDKRKTYIRDEYNRLSNIEQHLGFQKQWLQKDAERWNLIEFLEQLGPTVDNPIADRQAPVDS